jgi:NAD(P)-dependent dehydrogenase (short-subunit alcohol dehydrogenase family)
MTRLTGNKILVTGPAGQIAFPLAARLARENEVWGIARFGDPAGRERVEKAGIRACRVDLADPDWGDLPDGFDYVLHLAAAIVPGTDFDSALRINAEGTGHVMSRFRGAKACRPAVSTRPRRIRTTRARKGTRWAGAPSPTHRPIASRRLRRKRWPGSQRSNMDCRRYWPG